jgi:hypothetical protein
MNAHKSAVKRPSKMPLVISLAVALLLIANAIAEWGPEAKKIAAGIERDLCELNLTQIVDNLIYVLTGCKAIYDDIPRYFFNDFCHVPHYTLDHLDCPPFNLTRLFNIPGAVFFAAKRVWYREGLTGASLAGVSLLISSWFISSIHEFRLSLRNPIKSPPRGSLPLGILLLTRNILFFLFCIVGGGVVIGYFIQTFFVIVLGTLTTILGLLLWFVSIPAIIYAALAKPIELYHVYNSVKEFLHKWSGRPKP